MPEHILAAAIRLCCGVIVSLPKPARHHNIIRHLTATGCSMREIAESEQGFVTDAGRFVGREEALRIADAVGQIIDRRNCHERLFSENVW